MDSTHSLKDYYTGTLRRRGLNALENPAVILWAMHGSPTSLTPRGTPSRRGKSPRFSTEGPMQAGSSTLPSNYSNKPPTTFTSSLSIPVEGAVSIETDPSEESGSPHSPQEASTSNSNRAPRKSKTEALAALNSHARSSSVGPDDLGYQDHLTEKYLNSPPIPVSPVLDLSSVKTSSPRGNPIPRTMPRPFGLEDCPEFYPTMDEFKDPMAYIRSISDGAKKFGLCKVIPPVEWKMPFVTDTEVCSSFSFDIF